MFRNLQLFDNLSDEDILSAMKAVLVNEKRLVALLPKKPLLFLIPYTPDSFWEQRMADDLKPLIVDSEGYVGHKPDDSGPRPWGTYYESNGLRERLKPYRYKPGLFWVCDGPEFATEVISGFKRHLDGEPTFESDFIYPRLLIDERGTKLEALEIEYFSDEAHTKKIWGLIISSLSIYSLGVAEPNLGNKTENYLINTPEYAAVIEVWEKYWKDEKNGVSKEALILELTQKGFSMPSAKAIDRVSRPEWARQGGRSKK